MFLKLVRIDLFYNLKVIDFYLANHGSFYWDFNYEVSYEHFKTEIIRKLEVKLKW